MLSTVKNYTTTIYCALLALCTIAILWGNFFVTLCSIIITAFWILSGSFKSISTLFNRKAALCYLIIITMILVRCLVQFPHPAAIRAFTKYIPFLLFICVLGNCMELTHKQFRTVMFIFVCSLDINTFVCLANHFITQTDTSNFRSIGLFMSYIRLSLFTIVGCATCIYYLFYNQQYKPTPKERLFLWLSVIWLSFVIVILKTLIAYCIYAVLALIFCISQINNKSSKKIKITLLATFLIALIGIGSLVYSEARYFLFPDTIEEHALETTTALGNPYRHYTKGSHIENGHWENIYICEKELDSCWNAQTGTSVYDTSSTGFPYLPTLCRYMTSKNLRKDAQGFSNLSYEDIENVKNGFTNFRFTNNASIRKRIYEAFWEIFSYLNGENPNGHSITQRLEFLACAKHVTRQFPWIGAGAFAQTEMFKQYETDNILQPTNWNLPHNQYMLMCVTTGIVGFTIFMLCLIGMVLFSRKKWNMLTISWFITTFISFCSEDTMNTMAGTAFCAFLGGLILFAQPENNAQ